MEVSQARVAAYQAVTALDEGRLPEDELERLLPALDPRDRGLAFSLATGVLRHRLRLDWTISRFLKKPDKRLDPAVARILSIGFFQLLELSRVPVSAVVDESVKLAKLFARPGSPGLVNGVLRSALRSPTLPDPEQEIQDPVERLSVAQSHPPWLVKKMIQDLGMEEAEALCRANNTQPPLTLRIHPGRTDRESLVRLLSDAQLETEMSLYSPLGIKVTGPTGSVPDMPGYGEGLFSIQDEASQIVGQAAWPAGRNGKILDGCAGLGGKTLLLRHLAGPSTLVVALDPEIKRLGQIPREARRLDLSLPDLVIGNLLQRPLAEAAFDLVLVDAPCSNLGVIRRRPDVKWTKSEDEPRKKSKVQKRLLKAAARLVRPGGRLVYSVCTFTPEETDTPIRSLLQGRDDFSLCPASKVLTESAQELASPDGAIRAWPHRHGTDGFFAAVLIRTP